MEFAVRKGTTHPHTSRGMSSHTAMVHKAARTYDSDQFHSVCFRLENYDKDGSIVLEANLAPRHSSLSGAHVATLTRSLSAVFGVTAGFRTCLWKLLGFTFASYAASISAVLNPVVSGTSFQAPRRRRTVVPA